MPILPRQILPDPIIFLCLLQNPHIHIHHTHPLNATIPRLSAQRLDKRHRHPRQARVRVRLARLPRPPRVREDYRTGVFERPRRQRRGEEERFGAWVEREAVGGAVA